MAWVDTFGKPQTAPKGCHWVNTKFDTLSSFFTGGNSKIECDCTLTGQCEPGEPPPPPIWEFLPESLKDIYGDEVPGPSTHQLGEDHKPYDYHWGGWNDPFREGTGSLGRLQRRKHMSTSLRPITYLPLIMAGASGSEAQIGGGNATRPDVGAGIGLLFFCLAVVWNLV